MDFAQVIKTRHSIRQYRPDPVPEDALFRVLEAARLAPSACNKQPWLFYVVREESLRCRLFPAAGRAWVAVAPVLLIACSQPSDAWVRSWDQKNHSDIDLAITMEHVMLAATNEGLGTCWICAFNPQTIREVLTLPAALDPVAITPLGYSVETPAATPRKTLEEIVVWR